MLACNFWQDRRQSDWTRAMAMIGAWTGMADQDSICSACCTARPTRRRHIRKASQYEEFAMDWLVY